MAQQPTQTQQGASTGTSGFPLDDLAYDLVTVLHEKSKGLEAFDKYMRDAQRDPNVKKIFEDIRRQDTQAIEQLKTCLGRVLGNGGSMQQGQQGQSNVGSVAGTGTNGNNNRSGAV